MTRAARKKVSTFHGITLEQFAGVRVAVGAAIPLADVLEQEGIAPGAWPQAERAWTKAVADSPALSVELVEKTAIAEDCLGSTIEPLQSDPCAWVGLMSALATSSGADVLLEKLALTEADIGRLRRRWDARAEADPDLAEMLEELEATSKPPSSVTIVKPRLRPFPWTKLRPKLAPIPPVVAAIPTGPELVRQAPAVQQLATYQLLELTPAPAPIVAPAPVPILDSTAALPAPEVIRQMINAAEPRVAMSNAARSMPLEVKVAVPPNEERVGGRTELAPAPGRVAARVLPFQDGSSARNGDPIDSTMALPVAEDVRRMIAEAEPRAAMAKAKASGAQPTTSRTREPPPPRTSTGTEEVDEGLVRDVMQAVGRHNPDKSMARVAQSEPVRPAEENDASILAGLAAMAVPERRNLDVATLAAIAAEVRRNVALGDAIAARGITEAEWKEEIRAVLADGTRRAAFEAELEACLARGGR